MSTVTQNQARETALDIGSIRDEDVARFQADGAICLRGLFDREWVERMRSAVDRQIVGKGGFAVDRELWPTNADFRAFVFESPAAAIAQRLMGARQIRLLFDQLFVKEPGMETPTPWHHDQPFWPVQGRQICSIWLALDTVTNESSGLQYVKGSHLWEKEFRPEGFTRENKNLFAEARHGEAIPDFDALRDRYEFLSWDLAPGDCLVHQALAVHGASGNHTRTQRRRALSTRWIGDNVIYAPRPGMDAKLYDERIVPGAAMASDKFPLVIAA